ncbi:MAG: hypothetical protein GEU75_08435 [Dehalococcoidia bacterium]|nr:hypothetical protein [Dehalococcoidia bacterium]
MTSEMTRQSILNAVERIGSLAEIHVARSIGIETDSPIARDGKSIETREAIELIDYLQRRIGQSLVASGDALQALARSLQAPALQTSPGGIARDVNESAAIVCWLTDFETPLEERLHRASRRWLTDLEEARKLAVFTLQTDPANPSFQADLNDLIGKEIEVREWIEQVGLEARLMLSSTELLNRVFDAEFEYRLFSNLSHGNPYALQGLRRMQHEADSAATAFFYWIAASVDPFSKALMSYVRYLRPHDEADLEATINRLFDDAGIAEGEVRKHLRASTVPFGTEQY